MAFCAREPLFAHHAIEYCAELVYVEGLLDVVDGVELHRGNCRLKVGVTREHHDGDVGIEFADALQDFDTVHLGHHDVENREVVSTVSNFVFHCRRIIERFDLVAITLKQRLHVLRDAFVVVTDKDLDRRKFRCFRRLGHGYYSSGRTAFWEGDKSTPDAEFSSGFVEDFEGKTRVKLQPLDQAISEGGGGSPEASTNILSLEFSQEKGCFTQHLRGGTVMATDNLPNKTRRTEEDEIVGTCRSRDQGYVPRAHPAIFPTDGEHEPPSPRRNELRYHNQHLHGVSHPFPGHYVAHG